MTGYPFSATGKASANNPRAAQYVRMSTDLQKYSIQNQAEAIAAYAAGRGLSIVRKYADEGRSGLRLDGRASLKRLIQDVRSGGADFEFILVYDVSRWGRFQDADESAYYEFICKEAGIRVLYCAEQFENDGSLSSTILKNVKRAMAGEYSRELSAKVFIGQGRMASLGFWQGGPAGYGLCRQLIDESGALKARLRDGQRKSLQTDRVILVPGPRSEQKIVRRIFTSFVKQKKSRTEIAVELNADKIRSPRGNGWIMQTIDDILRNEKYIGHNVYNRASFKLQKKRVANPPEMWIRRDNAFKPIIAAELFAKAQDLIARGQRKLTDQEALDRLSALLRRKGHLSHKIISAAKSVPDSSVYIRRFGSLIAAYKRIGFTTKPKYHYAETAAKVDTVIGSVVDDIVLNVESLGGRAKFHDALRLLIINNEFAVSLRMAWAVRDGPGRARRWQLRSAKQGISDLTLVIRMEVSNVKVRDYYLLPTAGLALTKDRKIRVSSRVFAEAYRYDSLDTFYRMCADGAPRRKTP